MESPSEQEKPNVRVKWVRPPAMELMYGIAVFVFVFSLFYTTQIIAFCHEVVMRIPELAAQGFSMKVLQDPLFENGYVDYMTNGDVVSTATLWSDSVALLALLVATFMWKKRDTADFLGLRPPSLRTLALWLGAFVLVFFALEGVAMLVPDLESEFMKDMLGTSTSFPLLVMGSAILPAIFEEFLMRGLLLGTLRHVLDKHVAIAITSAAFVLMHMQYPWQLLLGILFPLAIFLGYARTNSKSIWTPILLHLINNVVAISFPQLP